HARGAGRGWRARRAGGGGYGARDRRGRARPHLRGLLHDEGAGHGARPLDRAPAGQRPGRAHRGGERGREGDALQGRAAGGVRRPRLNRITRTRPRASPSALRKLAVSPGARRKAASEVLALEEAKRHGDRRHHPDAKRGDGEPRTGRGAEEAPEHRAGVAQERCDVELKDEQDGGEVDRIERDRADQRTLDRVTCHSRVAAGPRSRTHAPFGAAGTTSYVLCTSPLPYVRVSMWRSLMSCGTGPNSGMPVPIRTGRRVIVIRWIKPAARKSWMVFPPSTYTCVSPRSPNCRTISSGGPDSVLTRSASVSGISS